MQNSLPLPEHAPDSVDTQFTFDYNVAGLSTSSISKALSAQAKSTQVQPAQAPIAVDLTPNFDLETAKNKAQILERNGNYAEAKSVYDKIAIENNLAIERVKLFEALGKSKDKSTFVAAMLACLQAVSKANTVPIDVRAGLIEHLTESVYSKKIPALQISRVVTNSPEISLTVKYPFAVSLVASATKHGDTPQNIALLKASLDDSKNKLEGFKKFDDIGRQAWAFELRGAFAQAIECYRKQQEMKQEATGKDDPEVLALSGDIARVLAEQGQFAQSEKLFEQTRASFKRIGTSDYRYVRLLESYADTLYRNNKKQLAGQVYKEAVSAYHETAIADEDKNRTMILKIQ